MKKSLKKGSSHKIKPATQYDGFKAVVEPLVSCKWNQGAPYNLLTPVMKNGKHYVTGCVATAMAQVMYYNQYPAKGQNIHTYTFAPEGQNSLVLTVDYSKETYDWSIMRDTYSGSDNDASASEVAKIMYDLGVSVSMQYNESGSGAFSYEAANALVDYFNYNSNLQLYTRSLYSEDLWMKKVYSELNANRPLMYSGSSNSGGHEFVIDGYNEDGFVHVNWGWGGSSDGYFDIALLNPGSSSFSEGQEMILGICPSSDGTSYEPQFLNSGDISYTPSSLNEGVMSVNATLSNMGRNKYVGSFAVIALEKSGNQKVIKYFSSSSKKGADTPEDFSLNHRQSSSFTIRSLNYAQAMSDAADGDYRFFIGVKSGDSWLPVHTGANNINSVVVKKNGSSYSLENDTDDIWMSQIVSTSGVSNVAAVSLVNNASTFNLTGQKVGGHYKGIVVRNGKKYLIK